MEYSLALEIGVRDGDVVDVQLFVRWDVDRSAKDDDVADECAGDVGEAGVVEAGREEPDTAVFVFRVKRAMVGVGVEVSLGGGIEVAVGKIVMAKNVFDLKGVKMGLLDVWTG